MTNNLDTLATALYVKTDDLLKASPHLAPYRPDVGIAPRLRDAELVTLSVMQALLGFTSEARRIRVWVVDSTPVECGRSRETVKRSDFAGWAEYLYCASHSRFFWGLRLRLVCTLHGLPVAFALTGAKADERETLLAMFEVESELLADRPGQTLIGDKNYFGRDFEGHLERDWHIQLLNEEHADHRAARARHRRRLPGRPPGREGGSCAPVRGRRACRRLGYLAQGIPWPRHGRRGPGPPRPPCPHHRTQGPGQVASARRPRRGQRHDSP
ncbi:transposase [Streptomyces sp. DvalAA-14]|uniref:transposase n=1 Tax=Streptomyces sp. DvalAA-14 TaxID=1839759 RepID=UPI00351F08ED